MQLWKRIADLIVSKSIKLSRNAKLVFTDPNGVETQLNPFVKTLTATYTIPETENGMTYILNSATEFVTTLPYPKAGLSFSFIVGAAPSSASYTVVTAGSANIILGQVLSSDLNAASDADFETSGGDTVTFVDSKAVKGDKLSAVCDGTNWYVSGACSLFDAITITTAS